MVDGETYTRAPCIVVGLTGNMTRSSLSNSCQTPEIRSFHAEIRRNNFNERRLLEHMCACLEGDMLKSDGEA